MSPEQNEGDVSTPEKGEDWNKWLLEETEKFESEKRQLEIDVSRMKRENAHLKGELARLRAPPQVIGTVRDILEDGRIGIKSSSGKYSRLLTSRRTSVVIKSGVILLWHPLLTELRRSWWSMLRMRIIT